MINDLDSLYPISSDRSAEMIECRLYSSVGGEDALLTTAGNASPIARALPAENHFFIGFSCSSTPWVAGRKSIMD